MNSARRRPRNLFGSATWAILLIAGTVVASPVSAEPVVQELPGTGPAQRLADSLRVLASNDTDVLALVAAGEAALDLDDADAAYGFFARARLVSGRNPFVEVGMGRTLVRLERPDEALSHFASARALGLDERRFAADRGLAQDVGGDFAAAQVDYRLALSGGWDVEVMRRLALSQAIGGDTRTALQTLEPLIAGGDAASWRARAFVLAMDGDLQGARGVASARMSPGMAGLFDRFFARLPTLNPAERARAVHFGDMPAEGTRYASARPGGEQVAVATNTQPPPRAQLSTASRARGGALIPRGEPLASLRRVERSTSPDRRTRVGRTARPDARPLAAAAVRSTPAPASPASPRPSPPLPPAFAVQLPQVPNQAGRDVLSPAATATQLDQVVLGQPSGPIVYVSSADAMTGPPAEAALPLARRPGAGTIALVDPDALLPGDTVFRPDGSIAALESGSLPNVTAAVPSTGAGVEPQPTSILPPASLPSRPRPNVSNGSTPVRPGFAAPLTTSARPGSSGSATVRAGEAVRNPVASPKPPVFVPKLGPGPKPAIAAGAKPKIAPPAKLPVAAIPTARSARKATTTPAVQTKPNATTKSADVKADPNGKTKSETKPTLVAERYWFQVATGGDAKVLASDLKRLRSKHKVLGKLPGATSPFGKTRRLVVGPFASLKEAKVFEVKATGDGLDGYVWISPEGFAVESLPSR